MKLAVGVIAGAALLTWVVGELAVFAALAGEQNRAGARG